MSNKFYKELKAGLEEYIAHLEGKIELHTTEIEVPKQLTEVRCIQSDKDHYEKITNW